MDRIRIVGFVAACLALLNACDRDAGRDQAPVAQPVVVYAAFADMNYLPALFAEFTAETGVHVIVRHGDARAIVDDVIGNAIEPPADVLWTPTASGAWRAAEKGELRPLRVAAVTENVPASLRDPDDYWTAVTYRQAVIVYNPGVGDAPADFARLADHSFKDQLCLSSAANSVNLAVIDLLIDTLDTRPAEIVVRGWRANLAKPVFATEAELIEAIRSGDCGIGIASNSAVVAARRAHPHAALAASMPAVTAADAEAIGVTRHARNPTGGAALVAWLLSIAPQARHAAHALSSPANRRASLSKEIRKLGGDLFVVTADPALAWDRYDAVRLAERARYR